MNLINQQLISGKIVKMAEEQIVTELTCSEFDNFIRNRLAVINFSADWSMPCLMIAPIIEELAEKLKTQVNFARVNIEDESKIASKCKVSSIPTIAIYKDGEIIERISGNINIDLIEEKLKNHLI